MSHALPEGSRVVKGFRADLRTSHAVRVEAFENECKLGRPERWEDEPAVGQDSSCWQPHRFRSVRATVQDLRLKSGSEVILLEALHVGRLRCFGPVRVLSDVTVVEVVGKLLFVIACVCSAPFVMMPPPGLCLTD